MTRPDPTNHQAADEAAFDFKGDSMDANQEADKSLTPLWDAMDCPDVTDDPFYDGFNDEQEKAK